MSDDERYDNYHHYNEVEFYLSRYTPTDDQCTHLITKILQQAVQDFLTYQNPQKASEKEMFFTARGLIFDPDYTVMWGDEEVKADYLFEVLGVDREWFQEKTIEQLEKAKK